MNVWRPAQRIRVKSLGLHWRDQRLLAFEVLDDAGDVKGVRPLGGSVEFGESWQDALVREFREELSVDISILNRPLVMENIYVHEGTTGHEILFISEVLFPAGAYEAADDIRFAEDNGEICTARWFDLNELGENGIELFPVGLKEILVAEKNKPTETPDTAGKVPTVAHRRPEKTKG